MDKFVIKTERKLHSENLIKIDSNKTFKQSTLQSLAGVVVLEEIEKAQEKLQNPNCSIEEKIEILHRLKDKKPSKEVLIKTQIGRTIRKLSKVL